MAPRTVRSTSPQRPAELVGEWPAATADEVDRCVARLAERQRAWAATPAPHRSALMEAAASRVQDAAGVLAELIVREVGKPIVEAEAEVARAVAILRYYAQAALDPEGELLPAADGSSWLMTRRHPRGVIALITPWNFPLAIPTWKLAPALAWGNAVVVKAASEATACALALAERLQLDALEVLPGNGKTGQHLARHGGIGALSFTGSSEVGHEVALAATAAGIPVQTEMGGVNASVILPDADLAAAARLIAMSAMGYAGQKCTATSRIIAVGNPSSVRDAVKAAVEELVVGDPVDRDVTVGPVITEAARAAVLEARAESGRLLTGARRWDREGWFVAPTLVDGVKPTDRVACQEVFGPFAVILDASSEHEALKLVNDSPYGLVAGLFTSDLERAMRFADGVQAGMVRVNAATTGVDFHAPFGGEKASGWGAREQGREVRSFVTKSRTVTMAPPLADRPHA